MTVAETPAAPGALELVLTFLLKTVEAAQGAPWWALLAWSLLVVALGLVALRMWLNHRLVADLGGRGMDKVRKGGNLDDLAGFVRTLRTGAGGTPRTRRHGVRRGRRR